jgi:cytoskeleton protein RodZ
VESASVKPTRNATRLPTIAVPVERSASSSENGSAASAPGTASLKRLYFEFAGESWVEVRDAEGRLLMAQLAQPGAQRSLGGKAPFTLVIGNASSVNLRYGEQDIDLRPHTRADVARLKVE